MSSDSWKEIAKRKVQDLPVSSETDNELWSKVAAEIGQSKVKNRIFLFPSRTWAYAASVACLIGVFASIVFLRNQQDPAPQAPFAHQRPKPTLDPSERGTTASVEKIEVAKPTMPQKKNSNAREVQLTAHHAVIHHQLTDGSELSLNAHSSLQIDRQFNQQKREVRLQGEATFEVVSNKTKPFVVHFGDCALTVLGTKFNVRNVPGETFMEVTVLEGTVSVQTAKKEKFVLTKGQQLFIPGEGKPSAQEVDALLYSAWNTTHLQFNNESLETVFKILGRKYGRLITLEPVIKKCSFSGDLSDLPFDEALAVVTHTHSLQVRNHMGAYQISGNVCE